MKNPYLIQRATKEIRDWKDGIDGILSFDYMGSSEFEWGALPQSLGRIRKHIPDYTYMDVPFKGKIITVFCHSDNKIDVKEHLEKIYDKKTHLKEFAGFNEHLTKDDDYYKKFNCWWDIENDLFFWVKDNDFEKAFKEKIEPRP